MIAQFDVNTIWRRQFGLALRRQRPDTLLLAPHGLPARHREPAGSGVIPIALPPGWASRTSALSMPFLRHRLKRLAGRRGGAVDSMIFTSFHYLPLARAIAGKTRIFYYCSDDYAGYDRWGGEAALDREGELCRLATASIFVSAALRDRAVARYGLAESRCIVAPNASEPRFAAPSMPPPALTALPRPIFGTVGVFNDRIDYDFLAAVARSPDVGALALVGPVDPGGKHQAAIDRLRQCPKIHWFGAQPHEQVNRWMAGIDVAVIPYARTRFNHFCSPMRLWDHLAIGQPILATDACDQIARQPGIWLVPSDFHGIDEAIGKAASACAAGRRPHLETWDERAAMLLPWLDA